MIPLDVDPASEVQEDEKKSSDSKIWLRCPGGKGHFAPKISISIASESCMFRNACI